VLDRDVMSLIKVGDEKGSAITASIRRIRVARGSARRLVLGRAAGRRPSAATITPSCGGKTLDELRPLSGRHTQRPSISAGWTSESTRRSPRRSPGSRRALPNR
jgi:hypothetical protein